MAISTETSAPAALPVAEARRAGRELLLEWVFQPLSALVVPLLVRLRVAPQVVVLANACAGLAAAVAIGLDELLPGAVLLQAKTLLDNCDGQLARASGRVTLAGRYLDTIADLIVNAALFAALAHVTGKPLLSLAAFLALTFVLTVDFNVSELARAATGDPARPPAESGSRGERALATVYRVVFAPQDRLVRTLSERRLERVAKGSRTTLLEQAYFDSASLMVLANLGLTTQLAVLGACLVFDVPALYPWLAVGSLVTLLPLQLRRERLVRKAATLDGGNA